MCSRTTNGPIKREENSPRTKKEKIDQSEARGHQVTSAVAGGDDDALPKTRWARSGLQLGSGWLDMADQVRYIMYSDTKLDCSRPEFGWCS